MIKFQFKMKIPSISSVVQMLSYIPIVLLQIIFILFFEILMFGVTLTAGLISGKMVVVNIYFILGKVEVIQGSSRMFKEVLWGGIMMIIIYFFIIKPFEKYILKPIQDVLFKKILDVAELILALLDAYLLGLCFAEISILFEIRYCLTQFDFQWLNGPIRAFIYMIDNFPSSLKLDEDNFEESISFPLVIAFTYPIYSLIRCYLATKNSKFSVSAFLEKCFPKPCFCENEDDIVKEYNVDWKSQTYGLLIEIWELMNIYIPVVVLTQFAIVLVGTWRPGFFFAGFGILGFIYCLGMMIVEFSYFPHIFERAKNGFEGRIVFNFCILTYFVTKTFLAFFEIGKEDNCLSGHMEIKSQISQYFALYFTICLYSAWKIVFLCVHFHNCDNSEIIVKYVSGQPDQNKKLATPCPSSHRINKDEELYEKMETGENLDTTEDEKIPK